MHERTKYDDEIFSHALFFFLPKNLWKVKLTWLEIWLLETVIQGPKVMFAPIINKNCLIEYVAQIQTLLDQSYDFISIECLSASLKFLLTIFKLNCWFLIQFNAKVKIFTCSQTIWALFYNTIQSGYYWGDFWGYTGTGSMKYSAFQKNSFFPLYEVN